MPTPTAVVQGFKMPKEGEAVVGSAATQLARGDSSEFGKEDPLCPNKAKTQLIF